MKVKTKKGDQWINTWLEWRNQQEQSSRGVLKYVFFEKLSKIHRKTPALESLYNEVSGLETCNFIKK